MPREFFGAVIRPSARGATRKWPTVLISFAAHSAALLLLLVIPLMATGALPIPRSRLTVLTVLPPPLPALPPVRRAPSPSPAVSRDAAPTVSPDGIAPEPEIDPGFETRYADAIGVVDGLAGDRIDNVLPPPPAPPPPALAAVRVGDKVKAPVKIHDVPPTYPLIALSARMEGVVILEAIVGVDGRVQDLRILRSQPLLDQAAVDAVRQWIYTPTMLNGVPVPVVMSVTVHFRLQR